jgi:hypothetical protein
VAEQVEGGRNEAQGVQHGGLEGHAGGDLLVGAWPYLMIHRLHQLHPIHDSSHQTQVGQVVDLKISIGFHPKILKPR